MLRRRWHNIAKQRAVIGRHDASHRVTKRVEQLRCDFEATVMHERHHRASICHRERQQESVAGIQRSIRRGQLQPWPLDVRLIGEIEQHQQLEEWLRRRQLTPLLNVGKRDVRERLSPELCTLQFTDPLA